tara:strand:- start:913 stop:1599 length:687 start_codon:yes stop_codon:yes gene_type:complete
MIQKHIMTAYDEDLADLNRLLKMMGEKTISQMEKAIHCLVDRDVELSEQVISADAEIDTFERDIDALAIRIIALRQPVAKDLRLLIAALKIASHIERIADYARNIARRSLSLNTMPQINAIKPLKRMVKHAISMIRDVLEAYAETNLDLAMKVWHRDADLDEMYTSYLREILTYMMEDARNIGPCTQLLFAAKNIERMGDHITNIAEMIHYFVIGKPFDELTLKKDEA